ncbi:hypothetical protein PoB_006130500 [Plakobranchus ocellatus]|uniref:Uncharacterized protein n=1 Tax=Plakobranchus ocellatus TaxID=259542 RepID=A0AAV4CSA8_9GAST|nr:hypothetical protein PoB_006130500 [Plakobranchus ocellatus]
MASLAPSRGTEDPDMYVMVDAATTRAQALPGTATRSLRVLTVERHGEYQVLLKDSCPITRHPVDSVCDNVPSLRMPEDGVWDDEVESNPDPRREDAD